ncbi:Threonyl and Alanyl tRNA synthetase second additional domain-containing protein [Paenibacillus sp. yr247]|uniref:alanine-tRNA synthetase second additional domain-containing protein n=1 Tax=Paenibacillus sp. yr247 TaxID=1761880 RepID=UPI0008838B77|nr:hypothetical protein [Paenibacillus sp. yr247]SDM78321.1 Threonyl and Alanyl tRNA synthetase second additional domain-containing protein [Paenibacillus sp. yr247]
MLFPAEVVLELVYKKLKGIEKIGAHIAQDKARHKVIEADYDIISAFDDEGNGRRYWEIKGFSKVPCGGSHLKKTGEMGVIKLKRNNIVPITEKTSMK